MTSWKKHLLPPDSAEDALWHSSVRLHHALPSRLPVTTLSVMLYCFAVALMIYLKEQEALRMNADLLRAEWETRRAFGMRNLDEIWAGNWLSLLSASGQHFGFIHLLFNMIWLYRLGGAIERGFGSLACLGIIFVSAWVSSGFQLAVEINPLSSAAGMSGVVYAMAGFLWIAWRKEPGTLDFFNSRTAKFFLGWQVLCFLLTWTGSLNVANTAHISGLLCGLGLGALAGFNAPAKRATGGLLAGVMTAGVFAMLHFGAPWNPTWHLHKAYRAHINFELDEAEAHYQWLEQYAPRPYQAQQNFNLRLLEIHRALLPDQPKPKIREEFPVPNPFRRY